MIIRLPAFVPSLGSDAYPSIESNNYGFSVILYTQPKCTSNACFLGGFSVSNLQRESGLLQKPTHPCLNAKYVTVKPGIQGRYTNKRCGGSGDGTQTLVWKQDGLIFSATFRHRDNIEQQLINVANSMATEAPIKPAR